MVSPQGVGGVRRPRWPGLCRARPRSVFIVGMTKDGSMPGCGSASADQTRFLADQP